MSRKNKKLLIGFLTVLFVAVNVFVFFPSPYLLPLFSLNVLLIFAVQFLGFGAASFIMTAIATFIGIFCMTKASHADVFAIPSVLLTLYGSLFLLYWYGEKLAARQRRYDQENDEATREIQALSSETAFYENRLQELNELSEKRGRLSKAAHELGSLLDPTEIQKKLIDAARTLFPTRAVALSYGQQNDPIDNYVIQKRQPVTAPQAMFKSHPLLAVPVFAQQGVAGILRVGGEIGGAVFGRDDLRLLEILASMASLSLDNSVLFSNVQDTALRDGLTGLLTHKAFQEHLEAQILEASRYKEPLSVILADVDHFKRVNDTHGHQAGDLILQGFAHVLARNVRDVDIVARYGGEEFVILLLQADEQAARQTAEAIRQDLMAQSFDTGRTQLSITSSFGVATFPDDATSAQQLMRKVDERLYRAKEAGRNRVWGRA